MLLLLPASLPIWASAAGSTSQSPVDDIFELMIAGGEWALLPMYCTRQ